MQEIEKLIKEFEKIDFSVRKAALATVVRLEGSAYRRPGARMLITDDGHWTGAVSGGCLEGDVLRKAREVMRTGTATSVVYDTHEGADGGLKISLGCEGIITIFIESLSSETGRKRFLSLKNILDPERPAAAALVFENKGSEGPKTGSRLLFQDDKIIWSDFKNADFEAGILQNLRNCMASGKSAESFSNSGESDGRLGIFNEIIRPKIRLVIAGAGYDVVPLVNLADNLGFRTELYDECAAHLLPVRFPKATCMVNTGHENFFEKVKPGKRTAVLLMTHNFEYDKEVVAQAVRNRPAYLGILGPKKRFDRICKELIISGIIRSEAELDFIHSPVGLDIGAETPEEIALSILAEIRAFFSGRTGGNLRNRQSGIHD